MIRQEDIYLKNTIVHILDSTVGMPVLSDTELEHGSDFADFIKAHIAKITSGDDLKSCSFSEDSVVRGYLDDLEEHGFVKVSQDISTHLFTIMNQNIDIPPADFIICHFSANENTYLALLKMNYKTSYTHHTDSDAFGNTNDIIKFKAILPNESQKLTEAAVINLTDYQIQLIEKKYDVNGTKTNYFSSLFLGCHGSLSSKSKLSIVTKEIDKVQKKYFDEEEQYAASMNTKNIIYTKLEEEGTLSIPDVLDKVFPEKPEFREEVTEKLEKYNISEAEITPQNTATLKRYEKQCLSTDTGVEIKIPMEQYRNGDSIEFITNEDGSISILIKNIGHITSKM